MQCAKKEEKIKKAEAALSEYEKELTEEEDLILTE